EAETGGNGRTRLGDDQGGVECRALGMGTYGADARHGQVGITWPASKLAPVSRSAGAPRRRWIASRRFPGIEPAARHGAVFPAPSPGSGGRRGDTWRVGGAGAGRW